MITGALGLLFGLGVGYFFALYKSAKNENLYLLRADEVVVKKPADGLILIAVTPDVMRKMIVSKPDDVMMQQVEARNLYSRTKLIES